LRNAHREGCGRGVVDAVDKHEDVRITERVIEAFELAA